MQLDFFTGPDETKREAHERIKPHKLALRERVFRAIKNSPFGLTDEEVQTMLGLTSQTETPRRGELVKAGRIVASGAVRHTRSGRKAVVWFPVENNREVV